MLARFDEVLEFFEDVQVDLKPLFPLQLFVEGGEVVRRSVGVSLVPFSFVRSSSVLFA